MDDNYTKLAKLVNCMSSKRFQKDRVQAIFSSGFDINYAVPTNSSAADFKSSWWGYTALHFAIEVAQDDSYVTFFLKQGADVTCKNNQEFSPIRLAYQTMGRAITESKKRRILEILLSRQVNSGNPANPRCNEGISHLHIAVYIEHIEAVKFFLESGVSPNEAINNDSLIFEGYSALHIATHNLNKKLIELLLEYGADPHQSNAHGISSLHFALSEQTNPCCKTWSVSDYEHVLDLMLKSNGNDLNPVDRCGVSHFHAYCTRTHTKRKEWEKFFKGGVDVNAQTSSNLQYFPSYTPLHFAIYCKLEKTMMILLERGANLFVENGESESPLYLALHWMYNKKPLRFIEILKTQKTLKSIRFQDGTSLLDFLAAIYNGDKLRRLLLKTTFVNSTIQLDSPLWPGLTVLHILMSLCCRYEEECAHIDCVDMCLRCGADVMIQDANGMTALHLAIRRETEVECIFDLLNAHNDFSVNPTDKDNFSHLHVACILGELEMVEKFLRNGFSPNEQISTKWRCLRAGSTALHIAAQIQSEELMKLLLEYGADPTILDADGFSCLHIAFASNHFHEFKSVMWLRLETLKSNPIAPGGLSHLHVACRSGEFEAVKTLLKFAADVNESINHKMSRIFNIPVCNVPFSQPPKKAFVGYTPLHFAVEAASEEIVELLLNNGADVEAKEENGLTPLHKALLSADEIPGIIRRLTREFKQNESSPKGFTRLHVACALGDLSWMKELLEAGEDANSRIDTGSPIWPGCTPLHVLIKKKFPQRNDAVKMLLDRILKNIEMGMLKNRPLHAWSFKNLYFRIVNRNISPLQLSKFPVDLEGLSPFHVCCMRNDSSVVEKFLEWGVDVDAHKDYLATQDPGFFPLHFAVCYGDKSVVELLLSKKINVDKEDSHGNTPLLLAASKRPELVYLFLRSNEFNTTIRNMSNKNVLDLIFDDPKNDDPKRINLVKHLLASKIDFSVKTSLVTKSACKYSGHVFKSLVGCITDLNEADANGHNFIHHLVLHCKKPGISHKYLAQRAEVLVDSGCDLDRRDNKGRTPLHCATLKKDFNKVSMLLSIGADINITDDNGNTPLSLAPKSVQAVLFEHANMLRAAGLYISPKNNRFIEKDADLTNENRDLIAMEQRNIIKSISLRDLITEKLFLNFPTLSKHNRQTILNYVQTKDLRKTFPKWLALFKLQRRRILKRSELLKPALVSLQGLIDVGLPDHCLESILMNLSNTDWQNIIYAEDKN